MHDLLLRAIEDIYDCIGEKFDHPRALETYSKATDNTGLFLAEVSPLQGGFKNYYSYNIPDEAMTVMLTKYDSAESSILFKNITLFPDRTPFLRKHFVPDDIFHISKQYKECCEPWGIHSDGASVFKRDIRTTTLCGFIRQPGQTEIDQNLLDIMTTLNNHYCRAMSLQSRLLQQQQASIQTCSMLDLINFGVVLYGKNRTPVFINAAAQRIIDDKDGIILKSEGLNFLDTKANQVFQNIIATLYQPNLAKGTKHPDVIKIPRISKAKPYSAMVVPIDEQRNKTLGSAPAVFLFDPTMDKTTVIDLFVTSYELSNSEAELAHCMALGDSLEKAAERRGVSRNTAKTQLHSIFAKTETSRQSELVSLLLRSVAGINLKTG